MILTVTLNPLLEHRLSFKTVQLGKVNRDSSEDSKAGGKGINVSRQLNFLGVENLAFLFLGGYNGKVLKKILSEENINFSSISINSDTRSAAIIIDESNDTVTSYFGKNPIISHEEIESFKSKLDKMIQNCEIVVFCGSSPCEEANSIFPYGIERANKHDKISVCDTYGSHLLDCIKTSPTILHNNFEETEKSLNIALKSEQEVIDHLKFLQSHNIKQSFLTDGANFSYASNFDFLYKVKNPSIKSTDSTGSGDAFVAGIIYGWHHNHPFEENLKLASALGAVNAAQNETCRVELNDALKIKDQIEIISLGKKMRFTNAPVL